ncbi:GNAT family N-acetyltransferase, partial [Corynebacterium diphtheriae]|uniref:GNAT family N-acetyltransferase n=1 Tax=Corynebacterium diphtheriae TaxID=1717 RepID=UPI001F53242A
PYAECVKSSKEIAVFSRLIIGIEIKIRICNVASRGVIERCGATFEGIAHKAELHRGLIYDIAIYSITS